MTTAEFAYDIGRGFLPGHRACAGCGQASAVRLIMEIAAPNCVATNATGCLEVFSTPYPETAWGVPWIHSLFENAASVAAGIEAALKKQGKLDDVKVLAFGGDGATLDIGFGPLSGMFERGHDVAYFCMDNEAYMNTGVQRSGSTPFAASTTTSPAGRRSFGEDRPKKDLPAIAAAHGLPYVATASMSFFADLRRKTKKALSIQGPKYLQIHVPCPPGWGYDEKLSVEIGELAVECGIYPLVEWENGEVVRVRKMKKKVPVEDYLKPQRRFRHLFRTEQGQVQIARIQELADANIAKYGLMD
jgi:pyruvate ferredoxin oxidoreductase beta subunit